MTALLQYFTAQKMKLSIKNFFSKCDQIRRKLHIWSHLMKNSLMEIFLKFPQKSSIFSTVQVINVGTVEQFHVQQSKLFWFQTSTGFWLYCCSETQHKKLCLNYLTIYQNSDLVLFELVVTGSLPRCTKNEVFH